MRVATSASLLLNSLAVVVTAETPKHGGYRLATHTILPRKAQTKLQELSPATQRIFPTHNRSRTNQSGRITGAMRRTVVYALDFILDTLDYSPDEPSVPVGKADLRLQPSADPLMKDQLCVVLWNDEKNSFDDVIKLLMDTTNRTREEANDTAIRIDEQGRDIIDMHASAARLLEIACTFSQIDLDVTVRRTYDTFRE